MHVTVMDDLHLQTDLGRTARALGLDLTLLVNPSSHLGRGFTVEYDRDEGASEGVSEGRVGGDSGTSEGDREGATDPLSRRSDSARGDEGGEGSYGGDHVYDTSLMSVLIGATLHATDQHPHHSPSHRRAQSPVRTSTASVQGLVRSWLEFWTKLDNTNAMWALADAQMVGSDHILP